MSRKKSREKAMEILFGMTISKDSVEEAIETFKDNIEDDINDADLEYITNILHGVEKNKAELDSILSGYLQNWKIERISKVNLAILRIAVYEIEYVDDVPGKVAVNEALEIAKIYSDEKSVSFINGVLDKIDSTK